MRPIKGGDADLALEVLRQFDPAFRVRPKRVEVVGMLAFVQGMPDAEVQRVMELPEGERRTELDRLAGHVGIYKTLPPGTIRAHSTELVTRSSNPGSEVR